jgi:hypothetical protein
MSISKFHLHPMQWLSSIAAVWLCSIGFASATDLRAQVARVADDGGIVLLTNRLVDKFPDGTPVAEAFVDISNGFLRLVRKGYKFNGDCLREVTTLYDANQIAVSVGNTVAGQSLFAVEATPVNLLGCNDDGCRALKNVVFPGEPPLVSARCDRSELSGNTCKCHLNDGSGTVVTNGDFCNSWQAVNVLIISQWVWPRFIQ